MGGIAFAPGADRERRNFARFLSSSPPLSKERGDIPSGFSTVLT